MNRITTSIDIAATPAAVWKVLMDWSRYAEWNPMLRAIEGQQRKGSKITVSIASPVGTLEIPAVVTRLVTNSGITWHSKMRLSGLFDRDHIIELSPASAGVRVTQTQTFAGILAPGASVVATGTVRDGLAKMNTALKDRVESLAAAP
jgi:hypothetical protein